MGKMNWTCNSIYSRGDRYGKFFSIENEKLWGAFTKKQTCLQATSLPSTHTHTTHTFEAQV